MQAYKVQAKSRKLSKNRGVEEGGWGCFPVSWLFATQQTGRQEYRSGLQFPPPGNIPNPSTEPTSHAFPALADGIFYHWEAQEQTEDVLNKIICKWKKVSVSATGNKIKKVTV